MSRSNPTTTTDPAVLRIKWSSEKGIFTAYDREKKENSDLQLPFTFIVLDELQMVAGYSEKAGCGLYSNLVPGNIQGIFKVKGNKPHPNLPIVGKWIDIKEKAGNMGAKWCKVIYAMAKNRTTEEFEMVRIELMGAAVSSFINNIKNPEVGAIKVAKFEEGKKGSVVYKFPVFEQVEIGKKLEDAAEAMDIELQKYVSSLSDQDIFDDSDMDTTPGQSDSPYPESFKANVVQEEKPVKKQIIEEDGLPF